jgi:hypothetical protein
MLRVAAYVGAAVIGLALVGGAWKLLSDARSAAAEPPRPLQPWERLP